MAWRIHDWDETRGCGSVVSPHFGPWEFGAAQNPDGTTDFAAGEAVVVDLEGKPPQYTVTSVRHQRPRPQPEGTECAEFDALNAGGHADARFEESPAGEVRVWLGDCCAWCGPFARVSFHGVAQVAGVEDDEDDFSTFDVDAPRLRFASDDEVKLHGLHVGEGTRAYCLAATPKTPVDEASPDLFVVAQRVSVSFHPCTR